MVSFESGLSAEMFELYWPITRVRLGKVLRDTDGRIVQELFAAEGRFVYKKADVPRTRKIIEQDLYVYDFLKERGFVNAPALLKTKDGQRYWVLNGVLIYVLEFIEGATPDHNQENWRQLGQIAAGLHSMTGYPYLSGWTPESETPKFLRNARTFLFGKKYLEIVNSLPKFNGLSQSLIHTDLCLNNVIQRNKTDMVLIDWDYCGLGTTVLDLGFPLICHFVDYEPAFQRDIAAAYYEAYFTRRSLPEQDRATIFQAGLFCALMYLPHGEAENNWRRIQFAINNRKLICSVLR